MKLLVATRETQGAKNGDFYFCEEGELVEFNFICGNGEKGLCGCERSFNGIVSRKATTVAKVAEIDTDFDEVADLVFKSETKAGMPISRKKSRERVDRILAVAGRFDVRDL